MKAFKTIAYTIIYMDKIIEKKKGIKKKHIFWGIGGLAFIWLISVAFFKESVSTVRINKDRISIATVEQGVFHDFTTISGNVEPIATIFLDAREGGRVEERLIEEGSMVKKGQVILRLSNPDLSLSILNSEAQLAEKSNFLRNTMVTMEQEKLLIKRELLNLEFDIKRKKRLFEQNQKLFKEEVIAKESFLVAKEDYEFAQRSFELYMERKKQDSIYRSIQVNQMELNLLNMERNLELVRKREAALDVKAPIDGQLTVLDIELGQSVPKGGRIGQIHVLTNYKVVAFIDEHYIDKVKSGLEATLERQGKHFKLKVRKVLPEVKNGRFAIELLFVGEKPDNMRTGQTYHCNLQLGSPKQAILVPKGAFFHETGGQWIYVLSTDESYAMRREISIGSLNPKYYEVLSGLEPGEKVIVSGYELFGDNEKVVFN
jgi:HlyD family secretion protein